MKSLSTLNQQKQDFISSKFWKKISVPGLEKEIEIKNLRIAQIKALSQAASESQNSKNMTMYLSQLTKIISDNSSLTSDEVMNLTVAQFTYIILQIRSLSKGNLVKYKVKCEHCSEKVEVELDIDNLIYSPDKNESNEIISEEDNMKIKYVLSPFLIKLVIANGKLLKDFNDFSKFDEVIACFIEKIETMDESGIYEEVKFTKKELLEHVGMFSAELTQKFSEYLSSFDTVYFEKEVECPNCGTKDTLKIRDMVDFLY